MSGQTPQGRDSDTRIPVTRRRVLQGIGATGLLGASVSSIDGARATDSTQSTSEPIILEQGDEQWELTPLTNDESVESFYGYDETGNERSNTSTGIEASNVSNLFFYEGPEGTSLVVQHDAPDGDTGVATLDFQGLPPNGEWVVKDDPSDFEGVGSETAPRWGWYPDSTDGGAYRGGLDGRFALYIDPFFQNGIEEWRLLSGDVAAGDGETETLTAFSVENDYSDQAQTTEWTTVTQDLSAYAGQEVTIELFADGRHTYDYENTLSWVEAEYVRIGSTVDEQFGDLSGWTCSNEPRGSGYDDTPVVGTCEIRDGAAYVGEETNRSRTLSRTVTLPDSGDLELEARVRGHVSDAWSTAALRVTVTEPGVPELATLDRSEPVLLSRGFDDNVRERLERNFRSIDDRQGTDTGDRNYEVTIEPYNSRTSFDIEFSTAVDPEIVRFPSNGSVTTDGTSVSGSIDDGSSSVTIGVDNYDIDSVEVSDGPLTLGAQFIPENFDPSVGLPPDGDRPRFCQFEVSGDGKYIVGAPFVDGVGTARGTRYGHVWGVNSTVESGPQFSNFVGLDQTGREDGAVSTFYIPIVTRSGGTNYGPVGLNFSAQDQVITMEHEGRNEPVETRFAPSDTELSNRAEPHDAVGAIGLVTGGVDKYQTAAFRKKPATLTRSADLYQPIPRQPCWMRLEDGVTVEVFKTDTDRGTRFV